MKNLFIALLFSAIVIPSAFAAPSIGLVTTIVQDLSTMNNEQASLAKATLVSQKNLTSDSQAITYRVELLEEQGQKAFKVDTYIVIVENGVTVRSIQLVK